MKKLTVLAVVLNVGFYGQDLAGARQAINKMDAHSDPVFAVATIKLSDPEWRNNTRFSYGNGQMHVFHQTLIELVAFAYDVQKKQVSGAPSWVSSERYDVVAKPDGEGEPSDRQWKTMMQKLLVERFHLTLHRERRVFPVYIFSIAKGGSKLTASKGDPNGAQNVFFAGLGQLSADNSAMDEFIRTMRNSALDRPIVDRTGLTGRYDFTLTWQPDEFQFADMRNGSMADNKEKADLYTAIQQQLGLKLEAGKAPADMIVIDSAAKPSEN